MNIIQRRIGLWKGLIILILCLVVSNEALAAAWTRAKGEAWISYEYLVSSNDNSYFLHQHDSNPVNFYRKKEYIAYGEYGVTDKTTFGWKLDKQSIKSSALNPGINTQTKSHLGNEIYGELFLRRKFFDNGKSVWSAFALYGQPLDNEALSERFNYRNTKDAVELGISYGRTLNHERINSLNGYEGFYPDTSHFINLQASYRKLFDAFYDEIHLDATLGIKMNSSSMMLFEVFHTYNVHANDDGDIGNFFKSVTYQEAVSEGQVVDDVKEENNTSLLNENTRVKISSVVKFSENTSIQLSTFKVFSSIGEETGFGVSMWYGF